MRSSEAKASPGEGVADVIVETCGRSHTGCVRASNEDGFLIGDLDRGVRLLSGGTMEAASEEDGIVVQPAGARGLLWLVCDGMGGAAAGEVASELATRLVWEEMAQAQATTDRVVYARLLRRAVRVANLRVWEQGRQDSHLRGMGTTLSAAGLVGNVVILAQIGDSRVYLARGEHLVQITRDQSVAAALVRAGRMRVEEVRVTPHAHAVLQALGIHRDVEVALSIARLRRGDRLLLCSDGLYDPLGDEGLRAVLDAHDSVGEAVDALIDAACKAGGPDNVTALLARFDGPGLALPIGEDVPRFTEMDPMEDGDRALVSTSRVAQRLAAQLGLGEDPGPPVVPATGQHTTPSPPPELQALVDRHRSMRASEVLEERSRLGLLPWVAAAMIALLAGALVLWDWL